MTVRELRELLYSLEDDAKVGINGEDEITGVELSKVYGIKDGETYVQSSFVTLF